MNDTFPIERLQIRGRGHSRSRMSQFGFFRGMVREAVATKPDRISCGGASGFMPNLSYCGSSGGSPAAAGGAWGNGASAEAAFLKGLHDVVVEAINDETDKALSESQSTLEEPHDQDMVGQTDGVGVKLKVHVF